MKTRALVFSGLLAAATLLQASWASEPQAEARLPVCTLSADGSRLAVEPCTKAPQQQARRSVAQVIQGLPSYKPSGNYGPDPVLPSAFTPSRPSIPPAPVPVNGCDAGGCRDASGVRHELGTGNAGVDRNGKLCNRHGAFLQCF
ncbi:MAG TPA: hypothetical protein VGP06_05205 [Janthinobacterium sp.]|nr:hypothetical protein [Janthinobacterium sp.]